MGIIYECNEYTNEECKTEGEKCKNNIIKREIFLLANTERYSECADIG
jgi:hypothetical protein